MGKMTIQDISRVLSERKGLSKKDASNFVNLMFDIIQQALERDGIVKVKGLGTFKIIDVDARESVNVNTGERVLIEGHNKITFTPDSLLKELVNKPFSQFETVVLNDGVDFDEPMEPVMNSTSMPLVDFDSSSEPAQDASSMPLVDFDDEYKEQPVSISETSEPNTSGVAIQEKPSEPETPLVSEESEGIESIEDEVKEEDDEEYNETSSDGDGKKWLYALVACLIGFACGYLLGALFPFTSNSPQNQAVVDKPQSVVMQPEKKLEAETLKVDTPKVVKSETEDSKSEVEAQQPKEPVAETTKTEAKNNEEKKVELKPVEKPVKEVVDKYSAMDSRVRTGAYRIVGTAQTVKVKEGDNLLKISRRNLGPDMECYLEVYNNLKASSVLKPGQEIKIPKLELKKKKKAQIVKQ